MSLKSFGNGLLLTHKEEDRAGVVAHGATEVGGLLGRRRPSQLPLPLQHPLEIPRRLGGSVSQVLLHTRILRALAFQRDL